MGLADRLASRYRGSHGISQDDLVQAARVGLVAAVDRYDPGRTNPFIVYAIACVHRRAQALPAGHLLACPRRADPQGAGAAGPPDE